MTITKESLLVLLGDRPVAYHPILAKKLGGVEEAIFVSQMLYWTGRGKLAGGWIFKNQADIESETGLSRRNQETARKRLKKLGVLSEELRGIPAILHYRINLDELAKLFNPQTSMHGSDLPDCAYRTDSDVRTVQTPETTAETTTEITNNGVDKKIDYLEHITMLDGKVSEATAVSPTDQWFVSRDTVLKIYEEVIGWGSNQEQRRIRKEAILTGVSERGIIKPEVWRQSIKNSVAHGVGPANIARFWEVYDCGGDYDAYTKKTYRSGNNGKGEYVEVDGKRIMI